MKKALFIFPFSTAWSWSVIPASAVNEDMFSPAIRYELHPIRHYERRFDPLIMATMVGNQHRVSIVMALSAGLNSRYINI